MPFIANAPGFKPFQAMAQGEHDFTVTVIAQDNTEFGSLMAICATNEAIYITKAQAMAFFNLVPKE